MSHHLLPKDNQIYLHQNWILDFAVAVRSILTFSPQKRVPRLAIHQVSLAPRCLSSATESTAKISRYWCSSLSWGCLTQFICWATWHLWFFRSLTSDLCPAHRNLRLRLEPTYQASRWTLQRITYTTRLLVHVRAFLMFQVLPSHGEINCCMSRL